MKRLLLILVLGLAACGGDNSTSVVTKIYNDAAVKAKAIEMVSSRELLAPNGGPISTEDLAGLLQIVKASCQSEADMQAMIRTMGTNLYMLSMTLKLVKAGCPDLVESLGIKVYG